MVFLALLFIPAIIALITFILFKTTTIKEFLIQIGIQVVIAGISAFICLNANTRDVEILNGVVTGKQQVTVSCSHSYSCNCRDECSGSGTSRQCRRVCDTCSEHFNDYDWEVNTSINESITIDRVDRQGVDEPPRFSAVKAGEPVSIEHSYTNYIKAAPESLFRMGGYDKVPVPKYPEVFDYYRINRLISTVPIQNPDAWNNDLSILNSSIGLSKQVNVMVIVTDKPHDFFFALQQKWIGGKKNDVVLVLGVNNYNIVWADVLTWSKTKDINIQLRDSVLNIGELDRVKIIQAIKYNVVKYYERKPMKDFEYLEASITPSLTAWIISIIIGILCSVGLSVFFHYNKKY